MAFTFNIAKGKIAHYASLPAASDALILVPLEASGLESSTTMKRKDTLAEVLAGSSNEQTTIGRKTITSVTVTVDDVNDRVDVDIDDPVWTAPTGNALGLLLVCYDSDTNSGSDSNIIPLTGHEFAVTPEGVDIVGTVPTGGFWRSQDAA